MNTFGKWDWYAYYGRPLDGPECLRRMGLLLFPCHPCIRGGDCQRLAVEGSNQCPHIRHWMYDNWPVLTGKIKAALSGSDTEKWPIKNNLSTF